jgi:hypothetical protein
MSALLDKPRLRPEKPVSFQVRQATCAAALSSSSTDLVFLQMRTLVFLVVCGTLAACSASNLGGNAAADVHVVRVDETPRAETDPDDIAVMHFVAGQRLPEGCHMLARLVMETHSMAHMRRAVVERAAELGATMVVIDQPEQRTAHNSASLSGVGAAVVASRYHVDALDCR